MAAERRFTYAASIAETSSGAVAFLFVVSVPGRTFAVCLLSGQQAPACGENVCAGILHVVGAGIRGDHLLFPGLRLAEARVSLCLQPLALVAS